MEVEDASILALQQCNDILRLQEEVCNLLQEKLIRRVDPEEFQALKKELQLEKSRHQHIQSLLEQESEKARCAQSELASLKRQLSREKTMFENVCGLLKSQSLTDSSKAEDLLEKCSALEVQCAQKDKELASKDQTIAKLQHQLMVAQERHCKDLVEVQVQAQQDAYVAKYLVQQERSQRRTKKQHL